MLKTSIRVRLLELLLGVGFLFTLPILVFAQTTGATLLISPESSTVSAGKTFTATIQIDSAQGFNTGNATLAYDPSMLSATAVSKGSSAFSLWAVEPSFDNGKGTVNFEGGNTTPLTGKKTILSVTFKALKEGKTEVTFSSGSVLAADGKGTDILSAKNSATYTIGAKEVIVEPTPTPPPSDDGGGGGNLKPDAPAITSTTHPDENVFYNGKKAKFSWELPPDVTIVRIALDSSSSTVPTTNYDPAISEKEFNDLSDGIMYLHLKYKNDAGWGPTTHRRVKIDLTPPPIFEVFAETDASSSDVILKFVATDTLSGLDRYELSVDGASGTKVSLAEMLSGQYTLTGQTVGDHKLKVSAFDKAGNAGEGNVSYKITYDPALAKKALEEGEPKPTDWRLIIDIILVAIIAFLLGYLWYERSAFGHEKYVSKREADEVRDNLGNIFAALREEVGEQVSYLFDKPNPSSLNREVLGNINEAIDLSEELLSKEVEDVRKLLS